MLKRILLVLLLTGSAFAANVKWTAKSKLAAGNDDMLFLVANDPNGVPASLAIGREEAFGNWPGTTSITTLGTVSSGTWQATDVDVPYGGTGVSTLTDGGVLLGSGAGAITATAVLQDGEILIGDGTTDPVALDVGSSTAITLLGTVSTGVWQGSVVGTTYGGTGAASLNDLITMSTHTTGNYVATVADAGSSTVTVAGSGSEGAAVTLDVADGGLLEVHLNASNAPTDNYLLTYNQAGLNYTWAPDTDVQLTEEEVEDYAGSLLGGTETHIAVTYQDGANNIDFVVDPDSVAGAITEGSYNDATIVSADIKDATVAFGDVDNTLTLAGNPALAAGEAYWSTTGIIFEGSTADTIEGLLVPADPTSADKTWTLPDATGTIVLKDSTDTLTNKTLAAANNVIEADTGDSATSFFSTGTLENARLDADLQTIASPTNWRLFYSNGSGAITELALGSSGQYLKSQGASAIPAWDTPGGSGDMTKAVYDVADNSVVDGDDTAYAASWDSNPDAPTKNAVYDKIETLGGGHNPVTLSVLAEKFLSLSTQEIDWDLADPGADRLLAWDEAPTDGPVYIDYSGWDTTASDDVTASDFTQNSGVLVGTGAGTYAEETGTVLRTSLGLGTTDNPQFNTVEVGGTTATISLAGAGDLNVEGNLIYRAGGTDVPDADVADDITITAGSQIAGGNPTFTTVEVANADTTISRAGAGDINVEGNIVYRAGGTDVPDADVADNITLTNITQISTRSHTSLTDIGTNAHSAIDTHIADTTDAHTVSSDTLTFTNKTIDADGTGNSVSNIDEDNCKNDSDLVQAAIIFVIDGGGSAISTGVAGDIVVPFACTIESVELHADQSGSIVVDIWKDTYANAPPLDADSITASAVPTLSSAQKSQDSTLTGWTTSITKGDVLRYNVDSITTCERVTVYLLVEK